jgi:histone H3
MARIEGLPRNTVPKPPIKIYARDNPRIKLIPKTIARIKKPHRFKPGTVALREIRKYQKSS